MVVLRAPQGDGNASEDGYGARCDLHVPSLLLQLNRSIPLLGMYLPQSPMGWVST